MKFWRNQCQLLISHHYTGQETLEGPLKADVRFYIKPPQYVSKPKKNHAALEAEIMPVGKKADLDNYIKALFDSANGIMYQDDGQIAEIHAVKVYSNSPRIELEISRIGSGGVVKIRNFNEEAVDG